MASKKTKKEKPANKHAGERRRKAQQESDREEVDDKMDFGGLPNRDLKKNLGGCG